MTLIYLQCSRSRGSSDFLQNRRNRVQPSYTVRNCVLVVTTVHEINRRSRETCMECGVTPRNRNNKQAPNITQNFGLQSSQMCCIHTDCVWMEAHSGYITVWTAGTINQLHMLPVLQPTRGFLTTPVHVCFWGVAECAVCAFFFFFNFRNTFSLEQRLLADERARAGQRTVFL